MSVSVHQFLLAASSAKKHPPTAWGPGPALCGSGPAPCGRGLGCCRVSAEPTRKKAPVCEDRLRFLNTVSLRFFTLPFLPSLCPPKVREEDVLASGHQLQRADALNWEQGLQRDVPLFLIATFGP